MEPPRAQFWHSSTPDLDAYCRSSVTPDNAFLEAASGIGSISALLGIIVAVWMFSPSQKYRHAGVPTSIPYKGWKRWHTILGLAFGVITLT